MTTFATCLVSGCNIAYQANLANLTIDTQRSLVVKTLTDSQQVCLEKTESPARQDDTDLISEALADLCSAYQIGRLAAAQYQAGIFAAAPLLVAAKAEPFLLAANSPMAGSLHSQLVESVRTNPNLKVLCCTLMTGNSDPNQPANRLCIAAFGPESQFGEKPYNNNSLH